MKVKGTSYRTVWLGEVPVVKLIEQNKLPFHFCIVSCQNHEETSVAIETMVVRGAGAIGATAGFAMAQAFCEATLIEEDRCRGDFLEKAKQRIEAKRPTAQNLFYATNRVYNAAIKNSSANFLAKEAIGEAIAIADEDVESCQLIGKHGAELIQDGANIQTHCNAGWLAFVDYGSALSPIYQARNQGKKDIHVWVDETRPRSQGARLTAWELYNEDISHTILPDNAGAHIMSQKPGKVDLMIVGADRIAANGDVANKIGTLEKAICAKYYKIPFYVAAPLSTFDLDCTDGTEIPIEERSPKEVFYQTGPTDDDDEKHTIRVASPGSNAANPAFDVTPAALVTGIITPKGIITPSVENIQKLFKES